MKGAINQLAKSNTAELDRRHPVKEGAVTRRQLGEQVAVNKHRMGTSSTGKVREVRQPAEAQIVEGAANMVELKRPADSELGSIFQTGISPKISKGMDLFYSYWALGGVGRTS